MSSIEPNHGSQTAAGGLHQPSLILRLMAIGLVILGIAGLFAYAAGWLTPGVLTPTRIFATDC
jgi:catalase